MSCIAKTAIISATRLGERVASPAGDASLKPSAINATHDMVRKELENQESHICVVDAIFIRNKGHTNLRPHDVPSAPYW